MRWSIDYIRSCFCKHEWELLQKTRIFEKGYEIPVNYEWVYRCKKCCCKKTIRI